MQAIDTFDHDVSLKLLIVSPTSGLFGGTEKVLEILISQLHSESQIGLAFLTEGPLVERATERGIPCRLVQRRHFSDPLDTFQVIRNLRKMIRVTRPKTVLAWTDMAQLYAAPAAFRLCKSVWWQQSNVDTGTVSRLCKILPSSGAIANSRFIQSQLRQRNFNVSHDPLYPPFDCEEFSEWDDNRKFALRDSLGLPQDRYIIGNVGRLQSWKGFDTFVDAISKIHHRFPKVYGVIVGGKHELEPEYDFKLKQRIDELDLADHLLVAGSQRNVSRWMGAMDVFVHTAKREPFGIVVPEAMALGLPVIASIPGGPSETIVPEVSGLLVESGNEAELVDAIVRIIECPELAKSLGQNARQQAGRFGSVGFVDRLIHAVQQSVSNGLR